MTAEVIQSAFELAKEQKVKTLTFVPQKLKNGALEVLCQLVTHEEKKASVLRKPRYFSYRLQVISCDFL